MTDRADRFIVPEDDIEIVKKSRSGLLLTPETIVEGRRRVAAGEDPKVVAFDMATEEVFIRSELDNPV
jgi:hypothetical protein